MAFSGLETLFQNLGPTTASMVAGQREADAREAESLAQQFQQQQILDAQQKYQQASTMNPLLVKQQQNVNAADEARLPGIVGETKGKVAAGNIAEASQADTIALNKATAETKRLEEYVKRADEYAKLNTRLGPLLENTPDLPGVRHAAIENFYAQNGLDTSSPAIQGMLKRWATIPSKDLPKKVQAELDHALEHSAAFKQAMATANVQKESHIEGARIQAGAHIRAAEIAAEARRATQNGISAGMRFMQLTPDKQLVAADKALSTGIDPLTGEELDDAGKKSWTAIKDKATELVNANLTARAQAGAQGITATVAPDKTINLANKPAVPQIGGPKLGTAANPIKLD